MPGWGYTKEDGPHTWENVAPAANGQRQSPIDIITDSATYDAALASNPLQWSYTPENAQKAFNNGHSVQVAYDSEGSSLTGGPLSNEYKLAQFHLHWGKEDSTGSEHQVDGNMYAAELHLVHWNADKYPSFGDAAGGDNGLCVLGVFLQVGNEHAGLKQLTDLLPQLIHSGDEVSIDGSLDPKLLLPENTTDYWTYPGSLTTPPLCESVTWVVFKTPIEVSPDQMEAFRALMQCKEGESLENEFDGHIVENYRPPQPLNERVVRKSFE